MNTAVGDVWTAVQEEAMAYVDETLSALGLTLNAALEDPEKEALREQGWQVMREALEEARQQFVAWSLWMSTRPNKA